ncbi:thermonuclease family protein [Peteryoungia desertarenae]|uniref:thermonuclease family protein n=1 Tax=Peteryoungia desertarenae TaxID=1813451 RepID=UPI001FE278CA|nr:thermonuclease family protein [Peteryoungia desertarenae]
MNAEIIRVIDGDTVLVDAHPWPDHRITTYVRLRGIDAPELKSKCQSERAAAKRACAELTKLLEADTRVTLTSISGDKYFGRVVADLTAADGKRPAEMLLATGHVAPYGGRTKPRRACDD